VPTTSGRQALSSAINRFAERIGRSAGEYSSYVASASSFFSVVQDSVHKHERHRVQMNENHNNGLSVEGVRNTLVQISEEIYKGAMVRLKKFDKSRVLNKGNTLHDPLSYKQPWLNHPIDPVIKGYLNPPSRSVVVVPGVEGAGKSTHVKTMILETAQQQDMVVLTVNFGKYEQVCNAKEVEPTKYLGTFLLQNILLSTPKCIQNPSHVDLAEVLTMIYNEHNKGIVLFLDQIDSLCDVDGMFGYWDEKGKFHRGPMEKLLYMLGHMGPSDETDITTFVTTNNALLAKKCISTNGLDKVGMIDDGSVDRLRFSENDCENFMTLFEDALIDYNKAIGKESDQIKTDGDVREKLKTIFTRASSIGYMKNKYTPVSFKPFTADRLKKMEEEVKPLEENWAKISQVHMREPEY